MPVGPEKLQFEKIKLFSVTTVRNILSCDYGLQKFTGICFHVYSPNIRLEKDKFSQQLQKYKSNYD